MSPAMNERLVEIAQAARKALYGTKTALYDSAAKELGISRANLLSKIKEVAMTNKRKRRSDSGDTALNETDARMIAAYIRSNTRDNGKRLVTVERAVETLRANGEITACKTDEETGEVTQLSISAIRRGLKNYGLDVETINAPAPAMQMASKHPNHLWEIDASICVLYYLPKDGLRVMDAAVFEKNKPENFKRIEMDRVWRYAVVDHCSGAIYVEYVFGAESGANVSQIFLNAMQQRGNNPFYGVPFNIYVDAGSANTGGVFKNLARSLTIDLRWHMPGNARATGAIEKAHDIIEREFEGRLKGVHIQSLEQLNTEAGRWMHMFNASRIHSRHQMTRYGAWTKIKQEQLRISPPLELCRELARTAPVERKVSKFLTIDFKGAEFNISHVPDICVNQKVLVCINPWRENSIQIVQQSAEGHDVFYEAVATVKTEFGFNDYANVYGEDIKSYAQTSAQKSAKSLDFLITGESTAEGIAKAIKDKKLPFDGRIDPFKTVTDFTVPDYIPRKGMALNIPSLAMPEIKPLTNMETKIKLRNMLDRPVTAEESDQLREWYPNGVMEEQLGEVKAALLNMNEAPRLVAVN